MSDPVVHITNGVPDSGTGNITTLGQTLTDGANITQGAIADAAVAAGATGSLSAKLRSISRDLVANIVLAAGSNIIGKFGIDQTTDGTTNKVAADLRLAGTAVTAGAGAVASGTPRMTLASNDPAVTSLATLAAAAGTAGTPSASVNTVQGIAGMTPVSNRERVFSAASTQLVRPANTTAYTANDEISAASPASLAITVSDVNDDPVAMSEILVSTTDTGFGGKNIRVWVYNGATTAGTDNGAFSSARANFVGTFSGALRATSDGAVGRLVPDEGTSLLTTPTSGAKTLQLRVQTLDAATPSANSTTFDFAAKGVQGRAA